MAASWLLPALLGSLLLPPSIGSFTQGPTSGKPVLQRVRWRRFPSASCSLTNASASRFAEARVGDLLAEIAARQMAKLPPEEMLARDSRTLDAIVDAGMAELYQQLAELDDGLGKVEANVSVALRGELDKLEARVLEGYDETLATLGEQTRPARDELREEMRRTIAAMQAAPRSAENPVPFYGRRKDTAVVSSSAGGSAYRACEQAAAAGFVLLTIAALFNVPFGSWLASMNEEAYEWAVVLWKVLFSTCAAVYMITISILLTKSEYNQFVEPED
ncbi:hypothetical protein AB1Y20_002583 [Prymnesium parvum]|uniref:Uncharacterized protein n=1 Tax=Prymnesium parvum TaxID=97485 RepID=A0AB34JC27_PRYPA